MSTLEEHKVTLVTGGAGGLGREIVRQLVDDGYFVVAHFFSSEGGAFTLREELGDQCAVVKADVSLKEEVRTMVEHISDRYGTLHNLINNAGVTADNLLVKQSEDEWDRLIDINLKGCFNCMQAVVPLMIDSGGGNIINISSFSGLRGKRGQAAYSASKAGMIGLGRAAAQEFGALNIRINTVLPGYLDTPMGRTAGKAMQTARSQSLLGTLSDPREVARFISYLCGAKHITGQIFSLDSRIV